MSAVITADDIDVTYPEAPVEDVKPAQLMPLALRHRAAGRVELARRLEARALILGAWPTVYAATASGLEPLGAAPGVTAAGR